MMWELYVTEGEIRKLSELDFGRKILISSYSRKRHLRNTTQHEQIQTYEKEQSKKSMKRREHL